jgi:hypothetical protein
MHDLPSTMVPFRSAEVGARECLLAKQIAIIHRITSLHPQPIRRECSRRIFLCLDKTKVSGAIVVRRNTLCVCDV